MSLKAKLEAVIYAAEEPITLAQLAALFAADALELKAAQAAEAPEAETLPLLPEEPEEAAGAATAEEDSAEAAEATEPAAEASAEIADPAATARQEAKQRDREVKAILRQILDELIKTYEADDRGIEIREIAGGYRMATKPACHDAVRLFVKSLKPPLKLSLPALETLAVIAYKQPVTAPEVSEIRGVESGGVLGSLMARKLIATAGRKQVIGRPILYKTTKEFLLRFGLKDLNELPSMEEFEKMAAVEIDEFESETAAETAPVPSEVSEDASDALEPTSQQAETEAAPDAPEESKQDASEEVAGKESSAVEGSREEDSREEDGSEKHSAEENGSEEGSGEKVSEHEAEEIR
jgi:segregation and condensation protein B